MKKKDILLLDLMFKKNIFYEIIIKIHFYFK